MMVLGVSKKWANRTSEIFSFGNNGYVQIGKKWQKQDLVEAKQRYLLIKIDCLHTNVTRLDSEIKHILTVIP